MQFAPPSSGEKGSAKSRPVVFGALGFGTRGARPRTAAIPPGCSAGSASVCADRCCAGSHIGMTCTVGCAGSGAAGWMSCGGRDGAGLARNPSGQTSARTLRGAGRGRSSTGLGPLRRTWTTSTTLLLPPPAPPLRGVLSTRRCPLCEDCAPRSFRRGKTRSASDMTFHDCARPPFGAAGFDVARTAAWAPGAGYGCLHEGAPPIGVQPESRTRSSRASSGGKGVVRAEPGSESGYGGPRRCTDDPAGQVMRGSRRKSSRSPSFVSSAMARPTAIMSATAASVFCSGRCLAGYRLPRRSALPPRAPAAVNGGGWLPGAGSGTRPGGAPSLHRLVAPTSAG
jgi:hypothetical protein